MTAPSAPPTLADIGEGIRSSWLALAGLPWLETWESPTPLPGWSVGDIAGHLVDLDTSYILTRSEPGSLEDLHRRTEEGVRRQRERPPSEVRADLARLARETPEVVIGTEDWNRPWPTVVGEMPAWMAFEMRLGDLYIHLLDLSEAMDLDSDLLRNPGVERALSRRVMRLAGWAAVKMAGLPDGTRVRLALTGPGQIEADLVVAGRRGRIIPPEGEPSSGRIAGDGLAFILAAGGRAHPAQILENLQVRGEAAASLVARFHLFG